MRVLTVALLVALFVEIVFGILHPTGAFVFALLCFGVALTFQLISQWLYRRQRHLRIAQLCFGGCLLSLVTYAVVMVLR